MLILEQAAENGFADQLVTVFNDKDGDNTSTLKEEIEKIGGIDGFKYPPKVHTNEVGVEIVEQFEGMNFIPTLMFVDPWGYKGLSLRLINSVLKDWACECIFFFNYSRINMGLSNDTVKEHMEALFGENRAAALQVRLGTLSPEKRELAIVEELCVALKELGGKYVLPFAFKDASGSRTKHHLFFVSKHPLGYGIMKGVMAKESSSVQQGVSSFAYNPADKDHPNLFGFVTTPEVLEKLLLDRFAGQILTMEQVYEQHNVGTPFISKNYKDVLAKLELEGRVTATPPHTERPKPKGEVTFGNSVRVSFPITPEGK